MAYAVNSIVGSISGIVAYSNDTTSSFNAELNFNGAQTLNFLNNAQESRDTLGRVKNTTSEVVEDFSNAFTLLNSTTSTLFSSFSWAAHSSAAVDDGRKITDVVYHMNFNVAFDDGTTYPVSATAQKIGGVLTRTLHSSSATNTFTDASNKAIIVDKIAAAYAQIITMSSYS